ncbi:MAG: hypothetical protein ACO3H6_02820 [Bacilli bacterium]
MSLSVTILTLFTILTVPTQQLFKLGLGESVDVNQLPADQGLRSFAQTLDASILATHTYTVTTDGIPSTYTFQFTNEATLITPLVGYFPIITSFHPVDQGWIEIYNPTLETISMADYKIIVNQNNYVFDEGITLLPFSSLVVPLAFGFGQNGATIGPNHPIQFWEAIELIWLVLNLPSPYLLEAIDLTNSVETSYGSIAIEEAWFQRDHRVVTPDFDYVPMHWKAIPMTEPFIPFTVASPIITPLQQAKAWATYVMYGAGMFAAGRVEEAFRALEAEYGWMSAAAKTLIFNAPNTIINGINENNEQDRSTFREAVGRFNYLAARVPGAVGLTMPPQTTFPWATIGYTVLALASISGLILLIKVKRQKRS